MHVPWRVKAVAKARGSHIRFAPMKWIVLFCSVLLLAYFPACERHPVSDLHALEHHDYGHAAAGGHGGIEKAAHGDAADEAPRFFPAPKSTPGSNGRH
jgi:hypothetical protein